LGYQGVIFADDMEMKAIADNFGVETAVVRGLEAGVDSFLCCKTASVAHRMINALDEACKEQERAHGQLFEALGRVEGFTRHWSTRIPSHPPEASADLALEVRERSSAFPLGTTADPTEMAAEDTRSVRQQKQQAQE
jgi:beta-glucosidase-like glycosyl hydrolase